MLERPRPKPDHVVAVGERRCVGKVHQRPHEALDAPPLLATIGRQAGRCWGSIEIVGAAHGD